MPFFAIKKQGDTEDIGICKAERIGDVDTDDFLGTVRVWEVREIDTVEAEILVRKLTDGLEGLEGLVRCVRPRLSDTPFGE